MILSRTSRFVASLLPVVLLFPYASAQADSGFYLGGSVGTAMVEANVSDPSLPDDFNFDENDFAWKAFGGYTLDLPLIDLGVEASYHDFGGPSVDLLGSTLGVDTTGFSAFGVAGIGLGPVHVFGKAGVLSWDADLNALGETFSEDGSDAAYGVGVRFALGSLEVRGEYEYFDVSDIDDLTMWSVGIAWIF